MKKSTYYFIDADGTENVSNIKPVRDNEHGFWIVPSIINGKQGDLLVELPKGTIEALFLKSYTWDDEPIKISK